MNKTELVSIIEKELIVFSKSGFNGTNEERREALAVILSNQKLYGIEGVIETDRALFYFPGFKDEIIKRLQSDNLIYNTNLKDVYFKTLAKKIVKTQFMKDVLFFTKFMNYGKVIEKSNSKIVINGFKSNFVKNHNDSFNIDYLIRQLRLDILNKTFHELVAEHMRINKIQLKSETNSCGVILGRSVTIKETSHGKIGIIVEGLNRPVKYKGWHKRRVVERHTDDDVFNIIRDVLNNIKSIKSVTQSISDFQNGGFKKRVFLLDWPQEILTGRLVINSEASKVVQRDSVTVALEILKSELATVNESIATHEKALNESVGKRDTIQSQIRSLENASEVVKNVLLNTKQR